MIKIKKGKLTLRIPAGSLRRYTSTGWETVDDYRSNSHSESYEEEEDIEYVDPEELSHRPLNELDRDELRILAEYKGLDVSTLSSTKQLRSAIRSLE